MKSLKVCALFSEEHSNFTVTWWIEYQISQKTLTHSKLPKYFRPNTIKDSSNLHNDFTFFILLSFSLIYHHFFSPISYPDLFSSAPRRFTRKKSLRFEWLETKSIKKKLFPHACPIHSGLIVTMIIIEFWNIFEDNKDEVSTQFWVWLKLRAEKSCKASQKKTLKFLLFRYNYCFVVLRADLFHTWTRQKELFTITLICILEEIEKSNGDKSRWRRRRKR